MAKIRIYRKLKDFWEKKWGREDIFENVKFEREI